MERVKTDQEKRQYQKIGGGSLRLTTGKIIKPNQKFWATKSQIPKNAFDLIIPVDGLPVETSPEEEVVDAVDQVYTVKSRGTGGWYDIVDQNDKVVNEKALKKDDAEQLIKELIAG